MSTLPFHVEVAAEAVSGAISTNGTKPMTISTVRTIDKAFLNDLFIVFLFLSLDKIYDRNRIKAAEENQLLLCGLISEVIIFVYAKKALSVKWA